MTRHNKIELAKLIMGCMYQHHIYEWMSLFETGSNILHRWVMFGPDNNKYKTVLQEMAKKGIVELRIDKTGIYAAFFEFLEFKCHTKDAFSVPDDQRKAILGRTSKSFILERIEVEMNRKLKAYKMIVP